MKPSYLKILHDNGTSFLVRKDIAPFWYGNLLYHPEFELMTVLEGTGTRFIGDSIANFKPGEIILLGSNLPHMWHSDDIYFQNNPELFCKSIVVQFRDDFLGTSFFEAPEIQDIKLFFERTHQGLCITGATSEIIRELMFTMSNEASRFHRLLMLFEILHKLANAQAKDLSPIASRGFVNDYTDMDAYRINEIYNYVLKHYNKKIELDEIASVANISSNSFCRYFKTKTRNTFTAFLLEVRIGKACKMIIEDQHNIAQICYQTGFQNLSNFNKQFKKIMNMTPLEYKKKYLQAI